MNWWKRRTSGIHKKGRVIWIGMLCVSLLAANHAASLTGNRIVRRAVYSLVNPVCGLASFSEQGEGEGFWRHLLLEILTVPIPLIAYLEADRAGETAVVGDPVYERYQSSEVLYNGTGGELLLGQSLSDNSNGSGQGSPAGQNGTSDGSGQSGQNGTSDGSGQLPEQSGSANGDGQSAENNQSGEHPASAQANHLPAVASGSLYTREQLRDFDYLVKQLYFVHSSTTVYPEQLDTDTLLAKDLTIDKEEEGAQILIHHTHGTEAFADSKEGGGKTILEVGDYLTELLEGYGYTVIHDKSIYAYDTAYSEASARVREILAANPTIQVVIDLHRDATGSMKRFVTELDGETAAQLMFFNGMCQTPDGPIDYLNNPYLEDNLAFSLQMKLLAEAYYPGLTRPNFLKAYQYNQHLMPRYTLVEAGSDTNTFDEVCRSMVPLAKILDAVLSDPDAVPLAGNQ